MNHTALLIRTLYKMYADNNLYVTYTALLIRTLYKMYADKNLYITYTALLMSAATAWHSTKYTCIVLQCFIILVVIQLFYLFHINIETSNTCLLSGDQVRDIQSHESDLLYMVVNGEVFARWHPLDLFMS